MLQSVLADICILLSLCSAVVFVSLIVFTALLNNVLTVSNMLLGFPMEYSWLVVCLFLPLFLQSDKVVFSKNTVKCIFCCSYWQTTSSHSRSIFVTSSSPILNNTVMAFHTLNAVGCVKDW